MPPITEREELKKLLEATKKLIRPNKEEQQGKEEGNAKKGEGRR